MLCEAEDKKAVASFLGQVADSVFPLSVQRESDKSALIYDNKWHILCRYAGDKPLPQAELKKLDDIIKLLNAEKRAANDSFLRPSLKDCALFREVIRHVWAMKKKDKDKIGAKTGIYAAKKLPVWSITDKGRLMKRSTVINKAVKLHFPEALAIALFARVVKAGIMQLHRITFGVNYYNRRFYADYDKLEEFLQMKPEALLPILSPMEAAVAVNIAPPPIFPGGEPWKSRGQGRKRDKSAAPPACAAESRSALSPKNAFSGGFNEFPDIIYKTEAEAHKMGAASSAGRPYPPVSIGNGAAKDVSSSDRTAAPVSMALSKKAAAEGTYKHNRLADKLRAELSQIFLNNKDLYECKRIIKFKKQDGNFNEKELRVINDIMKKLRGADYVLVEYNVPVMEAMPGQKRRMDLVAFYKSKGLLRIIDWKFGLGDVLIDNNEQLKNYARCLLEYVFPPSNVNEIEKIIVQPNGYDVIKTTKAYL